MKYDYFVVKDGQRYTGIDRSGQPVLPGRFLTQRAAFRSLATYVEAKAEIAQAAKLMDGWSL